jgi:hypothetical protein
VEEDQSEDIDSSQFCMARDGHFWDMRGSRVFRSCIVLPCWVSCSLDSDGWAYLGKHISAAVTGLYTSYTVPIFVSVIGGRDRLNPGPFSLG